jgi:hypothetical protein
MPASIKQRVKKTRKKGVNLLINISISYLQEYKPSKMIVITVKLSSTPVFCHLIYKQLPFRHRIIALNPLKLLCGSIEI